MSRPKISSAAPLPPQPKRILLFRSQRTKLKAFLGLVRTTDAVKGYCLRFGCAKWTIHRHHPERTHGVEGEDPDKKRGRSSVSFSCPPSVQTVIVPWWQVA